MNTRLVIVACFIAISLSAAGRSLISDGHATAQEIAWQSDIAQAKEIAARENKLVLIHFWGKSCGPCRRLEKFVFSQPIVAKSINESVVPVKIQDTANPELFAEYGIQRIPQDVVITPSGLIIMKRMSPENSNSYLHFMSRLAETNTVMAKKKGVLAESGQKAQKLSRTLSDEMMNLQNRDMELRRQSIANRSPIYSNQQNNTPRSDQEKRLTNPHVVGPTHQAPTHQAPTHQAPTHQAPAHEMPQPNYQFQSNSRIVNNNSQNPPNNNHASNQSNLNRMPLEDRTKTAENQTGIPSNPLRPMNSGKQVRLKNQFVDSSPVEQKSIEQKSIGQQSIVQKSIAPQSVDHMANNDLQSQTSIHDQRIASNIAPLNVAPIQTKNDRPTVPTMRGLCPVTILQKGEWVPGSEDWGCYHRGKLFLFASKQYRDLFMASPDIYCPMLVGFDPVEFHKHGKLVEGNVNTGLIVEFDGAKQMVLFATEKAKDEFAAKKEQYVDIIRTAMKPSGIDPGKMIR